MKDCNEQVKGFERAEVRMSEDGRADIYSKAKTNRSRLKSGLERNNSPFTGEETKSYEIAAGEDWRNSDPLANTKWFKDENKNRSPDATANGNDGQFVRIVPPSQGLRPQPARLVRQDL